jgi:hypothetical protein
MAKAKKKKAKKDKNFSAPERLYVPENCVGPIRYDRDPDGHRKATGCEHPIDAVENGLTEQIVAVYELVGYTTIKVIAEVRDCVESNGFNDRGD